MRNALAYAENRRQRAGVRPQGTAVPGGDLSWLENIMPGTSAANDTAVDAAQDAQDAQDTPQADDTAVQGEIDLKLFGAMMAAAHRLGLPYVKSFRLWVLIRWLGLQTKSRNSVAKNDLRAMFADNGEYAFTSWANLRKQINAAVKHGFLQKSKCGERIYFASERRVAVQVLGMEGVGRWAVRVPLTELTADITAVRALFYDAFHSSRGDGFNKPISRQSIQEATGLDKRTQKKYEAQRGIEKREQLAYVGRYSKKRYAITKQAERDRQKYNDENVKPTRVARAGTNRRGYPEKTIVEQLPNTYQGTLPTVARSRRYLNQRMAHLCKTLRSDGRNAVPPTGTYQTPIYPTRYVRPGQRVPRDAVGEYYVSLPAQHSGLWAARRVAI
jgi:hypothetical protein